MGYRVIGWGAGNVGEHSLPAIIERLDLDLVGLGGWLLSCLRKGGFEKTSLRDLAAEAQVSTSTIYSHFADNEELLEKAISDRLTALLETVSSETAGASPFEGLIQGTRLFHPHSGTRHLQCSCDPGEARVLSVVP